jgi:hypothetical protein
MYIYEMIYPTTEERERKRERERERVKILQKVLCE